MLIDDDKDLDLEVDNTDEDQEVEEDNNEDDGDDLSKVQEALRKERDSSKGLKKQIRELKKTAHGKSESGDADEKVTKAVSEANESWKGRFVNLAATNAFLSAGAPTVDKRLLRLIDVSDLEIADDGSVDGLDEQIEEIKEDYPQLFRKSRASNGPDLGPKDKTSAPKSASERQAAQLFGRNK